MNFHELLCYLFGHKWSHEYIYIWGGPKPKRRSSILNRKGGKKRTIYSTTNRCRKKLCYYCIRCGKISNNKPK